jgi:uncharacterized membrane protein
MATLTVWKFDTAEGADQALRTLQRLDDEHMIDLVDGAVVSFPEGAPKPKTHVLHLTSGKGALNGAFWGMLLGLIFFMPLIGAAFGAGLGVLTASLLDGIGIDDKFIAQVRETVTPGTSALFLYTQNVQGAVLDQLKTAQLHPTLIQSNLSVEQEARLREAFGEEAQIVAP